MAGKGALYASLLDFAKRKNPDGQAAIVVEQMNKFNPLQGDMLFRPSNGDMSHTTTIRAGLPTPIWRLLYTGTPPSKGTTKQVVDSCGLLVTRSQIDAKLKQIEGETFDEYRLSEDAAHMEAMGQALADAFIYGDTSKAPEKIVGLAPRYSSSTFETWANVVNAGGATANAQTSMFLISHDPRTFFGFFPKGSEAGVQFKNLGEDDAFDANGNPYTAIKGEYSADIGIVLRDWRYVVRVANIDVAALTNAGKASYTGPDIPNLMIDAHNKLFNDQVGRLVWYCGRKVKAALDKIARFDVKSGLTIETVDGKPITRWWGVEVKKMDAIVETEAVVS